MRATVLACTLLLAPATRAQAPAEPGPAGPAASDAAPAAPDMEAVEFGEAVQRAARYATSSALASEEVRRAEALLVETRSGALPYLSANGTYTRIEKNRLSGGVVVVPEEQRAANLSLSVPLVAPSRWYQWSHAADQVNVARTAEQDVGRSVTLLAARAYLAIVAQKRAIDVSERAVATAATHYDYAHTRRLGGVGNALDEARADQQLATSRAQLESARTGLVRAQEALGIAMGASGPVDASGEPDLTGGPATPDEGLRSAEEVRTDVRAARERALAAHRVARDAWADWSPTLTATGVSFYQDPPTSSTPRHGWQAQLLVSVPIFEGFLRAGQAQERNVLEAEAGTQLTGTLQQARADVRTAYRALQLAGAGLEQSRRAADSAHLALGIVEQAFRAGATTSLDVTDAERTARDADTSAVVAEDAVRQARLDLLAATGRFP